MALVSKATAIFVHKLPWMALVDYFISLFWREYGEHRHNDVLYNNSKYAMRAVPPAAAHPL
jgi:hypothetical protein